MSLLGPTLLLAVVAWLVAMTRRSRARQQAIGPRVYSSVEWLQMIGLTIAGCTIFVVFALLIQTQLPIVAVIGIELAFGTAVFSAMSRLQPRGEPAGDRPPPRLLRPRSTVDALGSAALFGGALVILGVTAGQPGDVVVGLLGGVFIVARYRRRRDTDT